MKNINQIIFIVIIISATFFSCESNSLNDFNEQQSNTVNVNDYTLSKELKTGIEVVNGILKFENADIAHKVFETLDKESDEYVKNLYLSCVSKEDYKEKIISGEFDENEVFKKFENFYQFSSLRNKIDMEMVKWLENEELDFKLKPTHIIADDAMQTILNESGEYMIGETIYKIDLSGNIYGIKDADFESLKTLKSILDLDEINYEKSSFVIPSNIYLAQGNGNARTIFNQDTNGSLKSVSALDLKANFSDEKNWSYDDGDKYVNGRGTVTNVVGVSHFVKAETESYEYKGWLRGWSRFKEHQYARVVAWIYVKNEDGDWVKVSTKVDLGYWEDDKQAEAKYSTWPDGLRIENGGLISTHKNDDESGGYIHLTW
ncbi:MAG: hypothetical protein JXP36_01490 [Bacteroidales bacterium]|nr:hypothetical protein [Bacteroidales bacterium]